MRGFRRKQISRLDRDYIFIRNLKYKREQNEELEINLRHRKEMIDGGLHRGECSNEIFKKRFIEGNFYYDDVRDLYNSYDEPVYSLTVDEDEPVCKEIVGYMELKDRYHYLSNLEKKDLMSDSESCELWNIHEDFSMLIENYLSRPQEEN